MANQWTSHTIRQAFLDYFKQADHPIMPGSPLVPEDDPTLLFTNAGMVPFKQVFLGHQDRPSPRACSVQRCVRAGGKHNDLDNVGFTLRHHTFFEMLGSFSFGDYFKRKAIQYAWDFLTNSLGINPSKLWVTVYETDNEAESIWLNDIGVLPERIARCGASENYWSMGNTGPCGPCTEIFYDHGPSLAGDPPGHGEEGERYVEIWNLVFMQFNRDEQGQLSELPKPCVDTGMGLERIASVMQGVHDNYHIDSFQHLMNEAAYLTGVRNNDQTSLRVIADHIRSTAFLILDGIIPSNEGRGYVLRRIIRRAIRHGRKLGQKQPFFYQLVKSLVAIMGPAYPDLEQGKSFIETVIHHEEAQFSSTLEAGLKRLDDAIDQSESQQITGEEVFHLYDTYGFPPDLTADIAKEQGYAVDMEGFHQAMARQRELSQARSGFASGYTTQLNIQQFSQFTGYETLKDQGDVVALIQGDQLLSKLPKDAQGAVILDRTPFYAEAGGQVGDTGYLSTDNGVFRVEDTQKVNDAYLHLGYVSSGTLSLGELARATVDSDRYTIQANHSATHLLHASLRQVLGEHAIQKGSLVNAHRLRFDFVSYEALTLDQIHEIENLVNDAIRNNLKGEIRHLTLEEARQSGAIALFGEKYGEKLRVLSYGDFSVEPCGGTHVERTGDIGFFKIIAQESVASGIRRLEALTGQAALAWVQQLESDIKSAQLSMKSEELGIKDAADNLMDYIRQQDKALERLTDQLITFQAKALASGAEPVNGVSLVAAQVKELSPKMLRTAVDQLKQQLKSGIVLLATLDQGKVHLAAGVTSDLTGQYKAGDLIKHTASIVGGRGGGRPDFAQGGGQHPEALEKALQSVKEWLCQ